jgi:iron(III) transport system substrate-binding protein
MKPLTSLSIILRLTGLIGLCFTLSCEEKTRHESVILYTSLDRPHSEPIIRLFEKQTGIHVKVVYDTEAAKTVGLVNRLIAEKKNPQADVFWNSEVLRTLILKEKGVLSPYTSPAADNIPSDMKDPAHYWTGFAARARVIFYNKTMVSDPPRTLEELTTPQWKGKVAIANPLFGTTNTQLAAWWSVWGVDRTKDFLRRLHDNDVIICQGNAMARDMVVRGEASVCLTDTDDAWAAIAHGHPVGMIYPDQDRGDKTGQGTLVIPNTVCMIKGGPNATNARKLIDFLLSEEVEKTLAHSESAQIPLRHVSGLPGHVETMLHIKRIPVDFAKAARCVRDAGLHVQKHFRPK